MYRIIILLLLSGIALADKEHHNTGGDVIDTSNVVGVSGSDTNALSYGPDVDINDCMAHWSALIITFPKRNKFCERQEFVRWAQTPEFHTSNSIIIMCSDPLASEVFGSRDNCIDVFTIEQVVPASGPCIECDHEEEIAITQMQVAQTVEEYESLEQRVARVERGSQIAAQKAEERREYAKHTIKRLENDPEE